MCGVITYKIDTFDDQNIIAIRILQVMMVYGMTIMIQKRTLAVEDDRQQRSDWRCHTGVIHNDDGISICQLYSYLHKKHVSHISMVGSLLCNVDLLWHMRLLNCRCCVLCAMLCYSADTRAYMLACLMYTFVHIHSASVFASPEASTSLCLCIHECCMLR